MHRLPSLGVLAILLHATVSQADDASARAALRKAVTFFHHTVSVEGGYVYQYSADLTLREGEGKTSPTTIFVQPPATPAVGDAFLRAWQRTSEPDCLAAARDAAHALVRGQLRSGGWAQRIELAPADRKAFAYRVGDPPGKKARNVTSLDDNQTQAALSFLMRYDKATKQKDAAVHDAVGYALTALLNAQHPNGAWSQGFTGPADPASPRDLKASFPDDWPRTHPGGDYWNHYTLNDNALADTIETMLLAADLYNRADCRAAAVRAGEFFIAAQLPQPQPGWAQQYDKAMHPAWARKFEPPAVSAGESQRVLLTLIDLYRATGDKRFLAPIPPALAWLKRSVLADGRFARFYELRTNKPLYFTRDYKLTHDDTDLPTHYGFKIKSDVDQIEKAYANADRPSDKNPSTVTADEAARLIAALDDRGAWVEDGELKYHKVKGRVLSSSTFAKNLDRLSLYVQQTKK